MQVHHHYDSQSFKPLSLKSSDVSLYGKPSSELKFGRQFQTGYEYTKRFLICEFDKEMVPGQSIQGMNTLANYTMNNKGEGDICSDNH